VIVMGGEAREWVGFVCARVRLFAELFKGGRRRLFHRSNVIGEKS